MVQAPVVPGTFHEEWFGPASQAALVDLYGKVAHLEGAIVEVGCWEGRSTVALAEACAPEPVHAVDTWEGSPYELSAQIAADRDVFAQFRANTAHLNVVAYRMGWRRYFAEFIRPIKFLHIDAAHTFLEVRDNIRAALPWLVPGAIICGDDAAHPPVLTAVVNVFPEAKVVATLWWEQL